MANERRTKNIFSKIKRVLQNGTKSMAILFAVFFSAITFTGCSVEDIQKLFGSGTTPSTDALGRILLRPVSVKHLAYEYITNANGESIPVTNENTGSLVFQDNPYIHTTVDGSASNFSWSNYQIVVDGESVYFEPRFKDGLQTVADMVAPAEVFSRFGITGTTLIHSNKFRGEDSQLNKYYDTATNYDFNLLSINKESGETTRTSADKSYIKLQYRLIVKNVRTNAEAYFNESTNEYQLSEPAENYANAIEFRVVFNPRLQNGAETRSIKVRRIVQTGSNIYGNSNLSNTLLFDASKLTFTVESSNSSEVGFAELTCDQITLENGESADKYYFFSKTQTYSSENKANYTTSLTGYFPVGKQVNVKRTYPGTLSKGVTATATATNSANYALQSWTVNSYRNEVDTTVLNANGESANFAVYSGVALNGSELQILKESNATNHYNNIGGTNCLVSDAHSGAGVVRQSYLSTDRTDILSTTGYLLPENTRPAVGEKYLANTLQSTITSGTGNDRLYFESINAQDKTSTITVVSNKANHGNVFKANYAKIKNFVIKGTAFDADNGLTKLGNLTINVLTRVYEDKDWRIEAKTGTLTSPSMVKTDPTTGEFTITGLSLTDFLLGSSTAISGNSYHLYSASYKNLSYAGNIKGLSVATENATNGKTFQDKTGISIIATTKDQNSNLNIQLVVKDANGNFVNIQDSNIDISYELISSISSDPDADGYVTTDVLLSTLLPSDSTLTGYNIQTYNNNDVFLMYFDPISGKTYQLNAIKTLTGATTDSSYTYTLTETDVSASEIITGTANGITLTEKQITTLNGTTLARLSTPKALNGSLNFTLAPYIQFANEYDAIKVFNQLFAYMYLEDGIEKYSSTQVAKQSGNRIYLDASRIESIQIAGNDYGSTTATKNQFSYRMLNGDHRGNVQDLSNVSLSEVNLTDLLPYLYVQAYYTLNLVGATAEIADGQTSLNYALSLSYLGSSFKVFNSDLSLAEHNVSSLSEFAIGSKNGKDITSNTTTLLDFITTFDSLQFNQFQIKDNTTLNVLYEDQSTPDNKPSTTNLVQSTKVIKVADNSKLFTLTGFNLTGANGQFTVQDANADSSTLLLKLSGIAENIPLTNGVISAVTKANASGSVVYQSGNFVSESQMVMFHQSSAKVFLQNLNTINQNSITPFSLITLVADESNPKGIINLIQTNKAITSLSSATDVVARVIGYYYNAERNDFIIEAYGSASLSPIYLQATLNQIGSDQTNYTYKDITNSVQKINGELVLTLFEEYSNGISTYYVQKSAEGLFAYDTTGTKIENATITPQGLTIGSTIYPVKTTSTTTYTYTANYFGKTDGSVTLQNSTSFANANLTGGSANVVATLLASGKYITYSPTLLNTFSQTKVSKNYFKANGYTLTLLGTDYANNLTQYYYYKDQENNTYKLVIEKLIKQSSGQNSYSTKVLGYTIVGNITDNLNQLTSSNIHLPDSYQKLAIANNGFMLVTYTKTAETSTNFISGDKLNEFLSLTETASENITSVQQLNDFVAKNNNLVSSYKNAPLSSTTYYKSSGVTSYVSGTTLASSTPMSNIQTYASFNPESKQYNYISAFSTQTSTTYSYKNNDSDSLTDLQAFASVQSLLSLTNKNTGVATITYNGSPVLVYAKYNPQTEKYDVELFILVYKAITYFNSTLLQSSVVTTDYAFGLQNSVQLSKTEGFNQSTTESLVNFTPLVFNSSFVTTRQQVTQYNYPITKADTASGLVLVDEIIIKHNGTTYNFTYNDAELCYRTSTIKLNLSRIYGVTKAIELNNSSSPSIFVPNADKFIYTYLTGGTFLRFNSINDLSANIYTSTQNGFACNSSTSTQIYTFATTDASINALKLKNSNSYLFYNCSNAKTKTYTVTLHKSNSDETPSYLNSVPTSNDSLFIRTEDGTTVLQNIKFTNNSNSSATSIIAKAYPSDLKSSAVTLRFSFDDTAIHENFYKALNTAGQTTAVRLADGTELRSFSVTETKTDEYGTPVTLAEGTYFIYNTPTKVTIASSGTVGVRLLNEYVQLTSTKFYYEIILNSNLVPVGFRYVTELYTQEENGTTMPDFLPNGAVKYKYNYAMLLTETASQNGHTLSYVPTDSLGSTLTETNRNIYLHYDLDSVRFATPVGTSYTTSTYTFLTTVIGESTPNGDILHFGQISNFDLLKFEYNGVVSSLYYASFNDLLTLTEINANSAIIRGDILSAIGKTLSQIIDQNADYLQFMPLNSTISYIYRYYKLMGAKIDPAFYYYFKSINQDAGVGAYITQEKVYTNDTTYEAVYYYNKDNNLVEFTDQVYAEYDKSNARIIKTVKALNKDGSTTTYFVATDTAGNTSLYTTYDSASSTLSGKLNDISLVLSTDGGIHGAQNAVIKLADGSFQEVSYYTYFITSGAGNGNAVYVTKTESGALSHVYTSLNELVYKSVTGEGESQTYTYQGATLLDGTYYDSASVTVDYYMYSTDGGKTFQKAYYNKDTNKYYSSVLGEYSLTTGVQIYQNAQDYYYFFNNQYFLATKNQEISKNIEFSLGECKTSADSVNSLLLYKIAGKYALSSLNADVQAEILSLVQENTNSTKTLQEIVSEDIFAQISDEIINLFEGSTLVEDISELNLFSYNFFDSFANSTTITKNYAINYSKTDLISLLAQNAGTNVAPSNITLIDTVTYTVPVFKDAENNFYIYQEIADITYIPTPNSKLQLIQINGEYYVKSSRSYHQVVPTQSDSTLTVFNNNLYAKSGKFIQATIKNSGLTTLSLVANGGAKLQFKQDAIYQVARYNNRTFIAGAGTTKANDNYFYPISLTNGESTSTYYINYGLSYASNSVSITFNSGNNYYVLSDITANTIVRANLYNSAGKLVASDNITLTEDLINQFTTSGKYSVYDNAGNLKTYDVFTDDRTTVVLRNLLVVFSADNLTRDFVGTPSTLPSTISQNGTTIATLNEVYQNNGNYYNTAINISEFSNAFTASITQNYTLYYRLKGELTNYNSVQEIINTIERLNRTNSELVKKSYEVEQVALTEDGESYFASQLPDSTQSTQYAIKLTNTDLILYTYSYKVDTPLINGTNCIVKYTYFNKLADDLSSMVKTESITYPELFNITADVTNGSTQIKTIYNAKLLKPLTYAETNSLRPVLGV